MKATFAMFDFGFKNLPKIERPTSENVIFRNQFHKTTCNHQHKYTMNKTNQESWQWNRHHQHVEKIKWSQIALPHLYLLHMPIKRGKGSFVVVTMFFGWEEEACLKAEDERCWELWGLGDLEEIKKIKLVCVCVCVCKWFRERKMLSFAYVMTYKKCCLCNVYLIPI